VTCSDLKAFGSPRGLQEPKKCGGRFYPAVIHESVTMLWSFSSLKKLGSRKISKVAWSTHVRRGNSVLPLTDPDRVLEQVGQTIKIEDLLQKKVFDIVASPQIKNLIFASAGGIYKTLDGEKWELLEDFGNNNHPIAIAKNGTVFVGPYVSQDHGLSFESYLRWDKLIKVLKYHHRPDSIRLLQVEPLDAQGQKLKIKLSLNDKKIRTLTTDDRGKSWKLR
jgi:hypothetical protein